MSIPQKRDGVGVVVGRFQVHELHEGHHALIKAADRHQRLFILIGVSSQLVTRNDPLDFQAREQMMREAYPNAIVMPLHDVGNDSVWSQSIDQKVGQIFPLDHKFIYFGRGSSRASYSGKFSIHEIEEVPHVSATDIRSHIGKHAEGSAIWRAGIIYAAHNVWPHIIPVVDIAITRRGKFGVEVLLGSRINEGGKRRLPGGHVDQRDQSYEAAAIREVKEETSLLIQSVQYIGSYTVKGGEGWSMKSTLFHAENHSGEAKGSDDLDSVEWVPLSRLSEFKFSDTHQMFCDELVKYLKRQAEAAQQQYTSER